MRTAIRLKILSGILIVSIILFLALNIIHVLFKGSSASYFIASAIFLILSNLLAYFFLNLFIFKKIDQIKSLSLSMASMDLSKRLDLNSGDEFEFIAQNLSKVIVNIHTQTQKFTGDTHSISLEKQKLQSIIEGISDAILAVDKDKKIALTNLKAVELLGLNRTEIEGKKISEIIKLSDKDSEISDLLYCPISEDGKAVTQFTKRDLKLSTVKKTAYTDLISNPIDTTSGINIACVLTLKDITNLKEVDDMKTDFVSMAAHELRTPLTTLKGYISVFVPEVDKLLSADQKMLLQNIKRASDQLMSLVENLLNVSRIDRGVVSLSMQKVDFVKLIQSTVNDFVSRAREKQIELIFTPPGKPVPQISVDQSRILEVLSNLITNAIKYTDPQGKINISLEASDHEVITHISDNGHGIAKEMIPYMFSKFFRVQGKLEYATKGTGLGLYITKSLIELHHGKIWVESEIGKGSTFSFSLPV